MKELTLEEVLQIAGGLPNLAALDELSYQATEPAIGSATVHETIEPARDSQST